MNTPTKELLAAAKAVFGTGETREQMLLLRAESKYVPVEISAGRILLAALEAAEAKVEAMASRESASVSKEIETSADMLAQVQNAEARVKELEERLKGTLQAGGYQYFYEQLHAAEREAGNARYVAEQLKKKLEAAEADGARLDWLEEAHKVQGINFAKYRSNDSTYIEHLMHSDDCEDIARGGNVREAIDAARKEAQP